MIVLTGAQIVGGLVTTVVGLAVLAGMFWRLLAAITRHIDATKANTTAVAALGTAMADHMTKSDRQYRQLDARTRRLERLNHVSA